MNYVTIMFASISVQLNIVKHTNDETKFAMPLMQQIVLHESDLSNVCLQNFASLMTFSCEELKLNGSTCVQTQNFVVTIQGQEILHTHKFNITDVNLVMYNVLVHDNFVSCQQ